MYQKSSALFRNQGGFFAPWGIFWRAGRRAKPAVEQLLALFLINRNDRSKEIPPHVLQVNINPRKTRVLDL